MSSLALYCGKTDCRTFIASGDILMLATVPPSQNHLAVKLSEQAMDKAYETVRKTPQTDPKKSLMCPYKVLCKQCGYNLGSVSLIEGYQLICFKMENIFFLQRGFQEIKGKKLKMIKEKLLASGLQVVKIESQRDKSLFTEDGASFSPPPSEPLVYCDVTKLTKEMAECLTTHTPREYQWELFKYALNANSLVFLPTGSGKTLVAALVISCMQKLNPRKLMVFITDRVPLVYQQSDYIKSQVPRLRIAVLAGDIDRFPGEREQWYSTMKALKEHRVDLLVLTHQILLNLMAKENRFVQMSDISVLVFDEVHHCFGNHPYNQIMQCYKQTGNRFKPLVLGLTASPAGAVDLPKTKAKLEKLLDNIDANACMPVMSCDLERFWNRPESIYQPAMLNEKQLRLQGAIQTYLEQMRTRIEICAGRPRGLEGFPVSSSNYKGALRRLKELCSGDRKKVDGLALTEHAMHMLGALELNSILGCKYALECLQECLGQMERPKSPWEKLKSRLMGKTSEFCDLKATVDSLNDVFFVSRFYSCDRFEMLINELRRFQELNKKDKTCRGIVFVKMRKTAQKLCERVSKDDSILNDLNPMPFVGHGKGSDGMAWFGEQDEVLKKFRSGKCKLLISTSVLEEGLDVPVCNLVIRFDSSISLRSLVQGRGRASRRRDSRFVVIYNDAKEREEALKAISQEQFMEQAMRIEQSKTFNRLQQAIKFGCQVQSLNVRNSTPGNEGGRDARQAHELEEDAGEPNEYKIKIKRKFSSKIKIRICNISTEEGSKDIPEAIDFLEGNSEVISSHPEATKPSSVKEGEVYKELHPITSIQFEIEPSEEQQGEFQSKAKFFRHVSDTWCSRERIILPGTRLSQMWLTRADIARDRVRKPVHILPTEYISIGYFLTRVHYAVHWQPVLHSIRLVFEHDFKRLLIYFSANQDLYKIEIRYREMEEYILVDKREGCPNSNVFLSVRHPPRIFRAVQRVEVDDNEEMDNFQDWYEDFYDEDEPYEDMEGFVDFDIDYDSDYESTTIQDEETDEEEEERAFEEPPSLFGGGDLDIENVVKWDRVVEITDRRRNRSDVFGECFTYRFEIPDTTYADLSHLLTTMARFDKKIYYAQMQSSERPLPMFNIPPYLPFDVSYATECLFSAHPSSKGRMGDTTKFKRLLESGNEKTVVVALEKLSLVLQREQFCDPVPIFEALLKQKHLHSSSISSKLLPSQCGLIKRLVITPTRLLFFPAEVMCKNRVLRNYNTEHFLCINIRDEDFSKLSAYSGKIEKLLGRVRTVLKSGVWLGNYLFQYLGCSNSQLRNHSCWLVRAPPPPEEIRTWMGDFSGIRCVGTFVARMGQCFSTSLDTVGIDVNEGASWEDDVDFETIDSKYCFSDGVGRISVMLAKEVTYKLAKDYNPSAFQIRFAGFKGVLSVDPKLRGKTAKFRPSMRKFQSPHRRLEVLQVSRAQDVYLNHQVIMLLSNLGVPDKVFMELQRTMMDTLAGMLVDERLAIQQLSSGAKTGVAYASLCNTGLNLTAEPYFKGLLAAIYRDRIHNLLSKARILLPREEARLMIGVMDETGILESGQVFVQYTDVNRNPDRHGVYAYGQRLTLTGRVVVTRNPCLHPGDVRLLQAVDVPQLKHHVDCIVFPRKGERPHPSQMAGGDLDGDLYFVCWYEDLLLTKPDYEPMNYEALPKKEVNHPITVDDMIDFVVDYILFDQLGIIDNAHKAHADIEQAGVESGICLKLAVLHSAAVDAPKTGEWPSIPMEARVEEYPDFMMKTDKPSYPSQKVLGKLYRECRSFKETIEGVPYNQTPCIDNSLLVPGFQQYVETARDIYEDYTEQLRTIMNLYGIESEAELQTGCFHRLNNRLGREKADIADIVRRILHVVRESFRQSFFEEFGLDGSLLNSRIIITEEMKQKLSAWYYVAYQCHDRSPDETAGAQQEKQVRFLSFPWLIDDVMLRVVKERKDTKQISPTIISAVSQSLLNLYGEERDSLLEWFKKRLRIKSHVSRFLAKENSSDRDPYLALFGSSANFLFRKDSDIDLCVVNKEVISKKKTFTKEQQLVVLKRLKPSVRRMFRNTRLVENARVPVIVCHGLHMETNLPRRTAFDLSASWDGLLKAIIVMNYIKSYPGLLPILRVVSQWGHDSHLTGHGEHAGINTTLLVFLVLVFCVYQQFVRDFEGESVWNTCLDISTGDVSDQDMYLGWEQVIHNLDALATNAMSASQMQQPSVVKVGHAPIGEVLFSFFRKYNFILDAEIPQQFSAFLGASHVSEILDPERLRMLREHMQRAFHILALHGNVRVLLNLSKSEVHRVIFLTGALSYTMMGSESHNARTLSKNTGAKVTIRPKLPGSGFGLVLEAVGTELAVRAVENALDVMTAQAARNRTSVMSHCFVQGANQMLFECCHSNDDYVTLVPYYGNNHPTHDGSALYVPLLSNPPREVVDIGSAFTREEFAAFREKILGQLEVVNRDYVPSLHGYLEFSVHFGRIYTFSLPKSFTEDTEQVTVEKFQSTLRRSYKALAALNLPVRVRTCRPKYSAAFAKKKGKRKKKASPLLSSVGEEEEEKKKRKERPSRSSFFTVIRSKEKLDAFLRSRCFKEYESFEVIAAEVRTDHEFVVKFDQNLNFKGIHFPKLRWSVTDVKRNWKENTSEESHELDGVETDVRFMLLSSRTLTNDDIRGTEYDKYRALLEAKPRATHSGIPFLVNKDLWKDVVLVRHKKSRVFRLDSSTVPIASEFMSKMAIYVSAVMEYSRPTRHASAFNKAFERYEVSLEPALPSNWSGGEVEQFLRDIWAFSFALSSYMVT